MDMLAAIQMDTDFLTIDDHTIFELEIFESKDGDSLYQFCNLTRTKGGEAVLKRRMQHPWAKAERIRATQTSITYIIENRELFNAFDPGNLSYITSSINAYLHAALPTIVPEDYFSFTFEAIGLYTTETNHFLTIARGVQLVRRLLKLLRYFLDQTKLSPSKGDLLPLLEEARSIVFKGPLSAVDLDQSNLGLIKFWRVLRLDQLFRVTEVEQVSRLLELVYEIDAILALADCTKKHNFILPVVDEGDLHVHADGLLHPSIPDAVANPVNLDQQRRGIFLTGPNMAGKTTYLRAFATALYLAHLGMGVPARQYHFTPVQQLISSISLSDNLHRGVSYFRAEALRVKDVANAVMDGYRVVAIMDEPFKGTNVKDTLEASLEILTRFSAMSNLLFMFSSHQIELAEQLREPIDFQCFAAIETEERLRFDYRLRPGVTTQRIGMRVLREEGVFQLLDNNL